MSSSLFPAPNPPNWAPTWPVKKTPVYSTIVQTPATGVAELRLPLYRYPRWQFELDLSYIKSDFSDPSGALATVVGFYMAMQGAANDWLYSDPYDNGVSGGETVFGTGDGVTTQFQLSRPLNNGVDLIQNLNGSPSIYISGALQTQGSYGISSTGLVTFATAPASGHTLTWAGAFYFRCRFLEDSLPALAETLYRIWELPSLKFISVILPTDTGVTPPVGTRWQLGTAGFGELGLTTVLS